MAGERRLRGLLALVHDAVDGATHLVAEGSEATHRSVRRATDALPAVAGPARLVDDGVRLGEAASRAAVRAVNRVVEGATGLALDGLLADDGPAAPPPLDAGAVGTAAWVADAALGVLNGAVGHHLAETGNPLDLGLALRVGDRYLAPGERLPHPGDAVVLVHGLGTTEWCWSLDAGARLGDPAATFGTLLRRDLGLTPIYVRYNTGRPIDRNGRALAEALEAALGDRAGRVVVVAHSMGGLVAGAALRAAAEAGHAWLRRVDRAVTLGTPHQGAPLARLGARATAGLGAVDLPATRVLARVLAARSAGVRDLEAGADDPLPPGVDAQFLAAGTPWLGDLLVPVASAAGPRPSAGAAPVTFPGLRHDELVSHPAVYAELVRRLA